MGFLDTRHNSAVLEEARSAYAEALGAWAQVDTWDTHVFVIWKDGDEYHAEMFKADNRAKGRGATVDDMVDCIYDGAWDEGVYETLGEAVAAVKGDFGKMTFERHPVTLLPTVNGHKLREALEAYEADNLW